MADQIITRRDLLKTAATAAGTVAVGSQIITSPRAAGAAVLLKKKYQIAIVPKALDNPVFYYAHYGLQQRATELGNVVPVWAGSVTSDAAEEAQVVESLISKGVDAIGISANAAEPLIAPINKAVAQGIKVITWDSDVPTSKRTLFYGVDSHAMGVRLAQFCTKLMGTSGSVILLSGGPGAPNLNTRLKGIHDELGKYPGIKIKGTFYHHDDLAQGQQMVDELLSANPTLGALIIVAGVPFFGKMSAMPVLIKNHGKIKVIATDTLAPELQFAKKGLVQALVGQDYWGWGYQSTSILYNLLTNKSCSYPKLVPQDMPVVTADNVDQWITKWAKASTPAGAAVAFKEKPIGCM